MKNLTLFCCLFILCNTGFCQDSTKSDPIDKLVEAMHMKKQINESADRMLEIQAESSPQLLQFKDVLSDFFHKYINWKNLGDDIKNIYAETFTESEIQDLITFYQTKTGQKLAKVRPVLTTKLAKLSQREVAKHQSELRNKIMNTSGN